MWVWLSGARNNCLSPTIEVVVALSDSAFMETINHHAQDALYKFRQRGRVVLSDIMKSLINLLTKRGLDPWFNRRMRAFFRRRLDSALGLVILACFLAIVSSSGAGQPVFITTPPAISSVTSTEGQGALRASANISWRFDGRHQNSSNEAAIRKIIHELNQSQLRLSAAAAQTSEERSEFAPKPINASALSETKPQDDEAQNLFRPLDK